MNRLKTFTYAFESITIEAFTFESVQLLEFAFKCNRLSVHLHL